jgi:UDP-glucuronate 4-epimerase
VILVTGAGGFLGRSVCEQLSRASRPCLGADLRDTEYACDVADGAAVARLFATHKIETVIHLAAVLPSAAHADPSLATRVNIAGSVNLIDRAAECGLRRFVFGSSMSVFGAAGDGTPLNEETPASPSEVYGAAKRYGEIYGDAIARNKGMSFLVLRIATIVGPGVRRTASPWRSEIFEKLARGAPQRIAIPFSEDAVLSLVHVEDTARMLILLATREPIPAHLYHTPAENWRIEDLKRAVEAVDANVTVELDSTSRRAGPPVADGTMFVRDFDYRALGLLRRMKALMPTAESERFRP